MIKDIADLMAEVRKKRPLVHHITNYVTVNDCANAVLCAGGSPVMTDAKEDVKEMARISSALVLNIGTLNERTVESMMSAGKAANKAGIPVILDPVGVGATSYRTETAWRIMEKVKVSVIKGNEGEIGVLAGTGGKVVGVDSVEGSEDRSMAAMSLAMKTGTIVSMTGKEDVISDGRRVFTTRNGHGYMGMVSGTGCMASSVTGCYAGVTDDLLTACVASLTVFSVAGEIAAKEAKGPGSFKTKLLDALYNLTEDDIISKAKVIAM